jgi:mannose/cellobiose epimerase-like protein (N-acyl-D-glucosamine 2-epimerase family)
MRTPPPAAWDELPVVRQETRRALDFWARHGPDGAGGWNVRLNADGSPYETSSRNVVAAARFVVNFSLGARAFDSERYFVSAADAFAGLRRTFKDVEHGGYFWIVKDGVPFDTRKLAYGHAFALLAAASAVKAGLAGSAEELAHLVGVAEEHFFGEQDLCWDTADADWSNIGLIHSNNPNMHFCEAFIATYEASGDRSHLDRALRIARALAKPPSEAGRPIWENYDADWQPLAEAPPGVDLLSMQSPATALPGHLAEWAKLLAILRHHSDELWLLDASTTQYRLAWHTGWDDAAGGFFTAIDAEDNVLRPNKSYWSPPEALGAAAVLQRITGDQSYAHDRHAVWSYMEKNMLDAENGGWFKAPGAPESRTDFRKGDEYDPDYHALGGCWEVLDVVRP